MTIIIWRKNLETKAYNYTFLKINIVRANLVELSNGLIRFVFFRTGGEIKCLTFSKFLYDRTTIDI